MTGCLSDCRHPLHFTCGFPSIFVAIPIHSHSWGLQPSVKRKYGDLRTFSRRKREVRDQQFHWQNTQNLCNLILMGDTLKMAYFDSTNCIFSCGQTPNQQKFINTKKRHEFCFWKCSFMSYIKLDMKCFNKALYTIIYFGI